jgi:hypothetical protein
VERDNVDKVEFRYELENREIEGARDAKSA